MDIRSKIIDNILYVMMIGEFDVYTCGYTRDYLDNLFQGSKFNEVVMDMSKLIFMDSTGIGVLLGRYKKLKSKNKQIFISNPSSTIEKIFRMSGIYEIMPKIN